MLRSVTAEGTAATRMCPGWAETAWLREVAIFEKCKNGLCSLTNLSHSGKWKLSSPPLRDVKNMNVRPDLRASRVLFARPTAGNTTAGTG